MHIYIYDYICHHYDLTAHFATIIFSKYRSMLGKGLVPLVTPPHAPGVPERHQWPIKQVEPFHHQFGAGLWNHISKPPAGWFMLVGMSNYINIKHKLHRCVVKCPIRMNSGSLLSRSGRLCRRSLLTTWRLWRWKWPEITWMNGSVHVSEIMVFIPWSHATWLL